MFDLVKLKEVIEVYGFVMWVVVVEIVGLVFCEIGVFMLVWEIG